MPAQPRRRLDVEEIADVTMVRFVDYEILDQENMRVAGEQMFSLIDELGRRKLVLDFNQVAYVTSAALGTLITLNKKLKAVGGQLTLCNLAPQIDEIFETTKLKKVFAIQR